MKKKWIIEVEYHGQDEPGITLKDITKVFEQSCTFTSFSIRIEK